MAISLTPKFSLVLETRKERNRLVHNMHRTVTKRITTISKLAEQTKKGWKNSTTQAFLGEQIFRSSQMAGII